MRQDDVNLHLWCVSFCMQIIPHSFHSWRWEPNELNRMTAIDRFEFDNNFRSDHGDPSDKFPIGWGEFYCKYLRSLWTHCLDRHVELRSKLWRKKIGATWAPLPSNWQSITIYQSPQSVGDIEHAAQTIKILTTYHISRIYYVMLVRVIERKETESALFLFRAHIMNENSNCCNRVSSSSNNNNKVY